MVEARDAAERPAVHSKANTIKNYSAQNVNSSCSLRNPRKHEIWGYAFKEPDNNIRQDVIGEQSRPT